MKKTLLFRAWFYFRTGWSLYFAFIFAAINTLVTTYYLAIERLPTLKELFPTFLYYVIFLVTIAIPVLVVVGYTHYKKSGAYRSEADIGYEINPYFKRLLHNTEIILPLYLKLSDSIVKISKNEKLSEKDIDEISKLQEKLSSYINSANTPGLDLDKIRNDAKI